MSPPITSPGDALGNGSAQHMFAKFILLVVCPPTLLLLSLLQSSAMAITNPEGFEVLGLLSLPSAISPSSRLLLDEKYRLIALLFPPKPFSFDPFLFNAANGDPGLDAPHFGPRSDRGEVFTPRRCNELGEELPLADCLPIGNSGCGDAAEGDDGLEVGSFVVSMFCVCDVPFTRKAPIALDANECIQNQSEVVST